MTCNDCLYYEACINLLELLNPKIKGKTLSFTKTCNHFKNKADFVEVVRCKDCKERYQYEDWDRDAQETVTCNECRKLHRDFGDDGFCSYGERRDT